MEERFIQVRKIDEFFDRDSRVILMGDFNARPGTRELLCLASYGFRHVLPEGWPRETTWSGGYAFADPYRQQPAPPAYATSEEAQNRPYTHLKHGSLIDHAFVRGFGPEWGFRLRVLPQRAARPFTDHAPIALTVTR